MAPDRDEFLARVRSRLVQLVGWMMPPGHALRRHLESGDVVSQACHRLLITLKNNPEFTTPNVDRLCARLLRHTLIDLRRQIYGPEGVGANHASVGPATNSNGVPLALDRPDSGEPDRRDRLLDLAAALDGLPDELREVVELHYFLGYTHDEAAAALGVSVPTVKRRWQQARLRLVELLDAP